MSETESVETLAITLIRIVPPDEATAAPVELSLRVAVPLVLATVTLEREGPVQSVVVQVATASWGTCSEWRLRVFRVASQFKKTRLEATPKFAVEQCRK